MLQKYSTLTPDAVSRFLTAKAKKIGGADTQAQDAGEFQLSAVSSSKPSAFTQSFAPAKGGGTLEDARGSDHMTRDGIVLSGERDIFGMPLDTRVLGLAEAAWIRVVGGLWNRSTWSAAGRRGNSWGGTTWSGNTWSGNSWSGNSGAETAGAATRGAAAPGADDVKRVPVCVDD